VGHSLRAAGTLFPGRPDRHGALADRRWRLQGRSNGQQGGRRQHCLRRQDHLAEGALNFKPPFRLLGNVYLGGSETEHSGEINLKDAMMPIVTFARLYSLRYQVGRTHTVERIESLSEKGEILPSSREEIISSYDFLMQLRLQSQLTMIKRGLPLTNVVRVNQLGYMQQEQLKQSFAQISAVQKKIEYDFLSGG